MIDVDFTPKRGQYWLTWTTEDGQQRESNTWIHVNAPDALNRIRRKRINKERKLNGMAPLRRGERTPTA